MKGMRHSDLPLVLALLVLGLAPRTGGAAQDKIAASFEERRLAAYPAGVGVRNVTFSADGRTVAYVAKSANSSAVVVGEEKGEEFAIVELLTLSADGKTVAYKAAVKEG